MGIIKGIVEFIATDTILEVTDKAIKGLDKASEAAQKKQIKNCKNFWIPIPGIAIFLLHKCDIN